MKIVFILNGINIISWNVRHPLRGVELDKNYMDGYNIIGIYWLVNTIVIAVVFTDEDDNSKIISSVAKIINKHIIILYICETISLAISIWLIQI